MFDLDSLQATFNQQTKKLVSGLTEAAQLNSAHLEALVARQAQLLSGLGDINSNYLKAISEKGEGVLSNSQAANQIYSEDVKAAITAFAEETTAASQALQENLKEVCSALVAVAEQKATKSTKASKKAG